VNALVRYTLSFSCGTFGDLQCSRWMLERQGVPGGEENLALFRYRGHGCPGPTRAVTKDGTVYDESYLDFWYGPHGWTHQFRCKICADPTGEMADITVADAWPNGKATEEEWGGYCLLVSRTATGDALMQRAIDARVLTVEPSSIQTFHACQPHQVVKKQGLKARLRALEDSGALGPVFENLRLDEAAAQQTEDFHARNYEGALTRIERRVNREPLP
jgi:coenzyme F420 hydrogenase subunit beta